MRSPICPSARAPIAAVAALALVIIVTGGCAGERTTTIPGGELPQPQCPEVPATDEQHEVIDTVGPWECPTEDYPVTVAAVAWRSFLDRPDTIPACGGGALGDIALPMSMLVPTAPVPGLDATSSIGLRVVRQPGGTFWHGTVALPAVSDPVVELTSITIGESAYPAASEPGSSGSKATRSTSCAPHSTSTLTFSTRGSTRGTRSTERGPTDPR